MKYIPPFNETDANATYKDFNLENGTDGSIPPAAAIENPMREIVNVIVGAGLTPFETDLTQLKQAIDALIAPKATIATDEEYATGSVTNKAPNVAQVKTGLAMVNFENISPAGKATAVGWGMPNTDASLSFVDNSSFDINGWLRVYAPMVVSGTSYIQLDGVEVYKKEDYDHINGYHKTSDSSWIPYFKGKRITVSGPFTTLIFYPMKG